MRTLKVSALLLAAWLAVFSVAVSAKALPRDDAAIAQQFVRVLKLVNERQLPIEMDFATTWVGVQGDYHSHEMAYYFVVEDYASEVYWEALESADEGEALRDMLMEQICTETKQTASA